VLHKLVSGESITEASSPQSHSFHEIGMARLQDGLEYSSGPRSILS
jgi:hypothetical protein